MSLLLDSWVRSIYILHTICLCNVVVSCAFMNAQSIYNMHLICYPHIILPVTRDKREASVVPIWVSQIQHPFPRRVIIICDQSASTGLLQLLSVGKWSEMFCPRFIRQIWWRGSLSLSLSHTHGPAHTHNAHHWQRATPLQHPRKTNGCKSLVKGVRATPFLSGSLRRCNIFVVPTSVLHVSAALTCCDFIFILDCPLAFHLHSLNTHTHTHTCAHTHTYTHTQIKAKIYPVATVLQCWVAVSEREGKRNVWHRPHTTKRTAARRPNPIFPFHHKTQTAAIIPYIPRDSVRRLILTEVCMKISFKYINPFTSLLPLPLPRLLLWEVWCQHISNGQAHPWHQPVEVQNNAVCQKCHMEGAS